MEELRLRINKAFDEEVIEIPWPHAKLCFGQSQTPDLTCPAGAQVNPADSKSCARYGAAIGH